MGTASTATATRCSSYELLTTAGAARRGVLRLPHGEVQTPAFMPVGTSGAVKGLLPSEVQGVGAEMILANTYHLWVRPGHERIRELGGLHTFMGWDRPILTDSGGFQAFSYRGDKSKVKEEGIRFLSEVDRQWRFLTPEVCVDIQEALGVDVAMALDECIEKEADRRRVVESTRRTTRWLKRCLAHRKHPERTALFGIVQGGFHKDLRLEHAGLLRDLDLDGYAIGGVSVGEGRAKMLATVEIVAPELPVDRVRYLMGVGTPLDIIEAVSRGVDIFDCVLPTRTARFGYLFTRNGKLCLKHSRFKDDPRPIDPGNTCYTLRPFSRAYLRHLFKTGDVLAPRLLSLHNLDFYQRLMNDIRVAIETGPEALDALRREAARWEEPYPDPDDS